MAEEIFGDPELEIHIRADWSQFDEDVKSKQDVGSTFGNEGRSNTIGSSRLALPDYTRAAGAAEQFSRAIENQVKAFERGAYAAQKMLPYYGIGGYSGGGAGPGVGGGGGGGPANINIPNAASWGGGRSLPPPPGSEGPWGGYNWSPDNENRMSNNQNYFPPDPGKGKNWWQKLSPFYRRFLALEAVRTFGVLLDTERQERVGEAAALGDPATIAQNELKAYKGFLSGMPFGTGSILGEFFDPGGKTEASITESLASSKQVSQEVAWGRGRIEANTRARENSIVAFTSLGLQQNLAQISAGAGQRQRAISLGAQAGYDEIAATHNRRRGEITTDPRYDNTDPWSLPYWTGYTPASRLAERDRRLGSEQLNYNREMQRYQAENTQQQQLIGDEAKHAADILISQNALTQGSLIAGGAQGAILAGVGLPAAGLMSRSGQQYMMQATQNAAMAGLIAQQQAELNTVAFNNPSLVYATSVAQRGQQQTLTFEQQTATAGQQAQWAAQDAMTQVEAKGVSSVAQQVLARQPRGAIIEQGLAKQRTSNRAADIAGTQLTPAHNAEIQAVKDETSVKLRAFDDARQLQNLDLKRQEEVTGIQATAYGPGARIAQMKAEARNISLETEEKALALQQGGQFDQADRQRRIGVNQLRGMEAKYLSGFQAAEGSLNRTNFSPQGATDNPVAVLTSIEREIKELNGKMGTLVAGD